MAMNMGECAKQSPLCKGRCHRVALRRGDNFCLPGFDFGNQVDQRWRWRDSVRSFLQCFGNQLANHGRTLCQFIIERQWLKPQRLKHLAVDQFDVEHPLGAQTASTAMRGNEIRFGDVALEAVC